jgi:hypothetical protein
MSKTISFTVVLAVAMLATGGREAKAQLSRQYGADALTFLGYGENQALQAVNNNLPANTGVPENPNYWLAYYFAYYAQFHAEQAAATDNDAEWYLAWNYALTAYRLEPADAAAAKYNLFYGYYFAWYAWYDRSIGY